MALLGDYYAMKKVYIEGLMDEPRYSSKAKVKAHQIKSKFNMGNRKTERWKESSDLGNLTTELGNAVLSHIRSVQHAGQAKGNIETLQQSHFSSAD